MDDIRKSLLAGFAACEHFSFIVPLGRAALHMEGDGVHHDHAVGVKADGLCPGKILAPVLLIKTMKQQGKVLSFSASRRPHHMHGKMPVFFNESIGNVDVVVQSPDVIEIRDRIRDILVVLFAVVVLVAWKQAVRQGPEFSAVDYHPVEFDLWQAGRKRLLQSIVAVRVIHGTKVRKC